MEDKVKKLGVIFDSRLSFEHQFKSLCSRLNGTISYLNIVKNTFDQKSRILIINALIFSHLNYCSSKWGKCSTKMYQLCCKSCKQYGKYLKRDHVTPLLRDLKWSNFYGNFRLNEASFMYKKLYVSADSNVKKINFGLRNKVSQRITRNGSDVHAYRLSKNSSGIKSCLSIGRKAVEFDPDKYHAEIKIPSLRSNVICTNTS